MKKVHIFLTLFVFVAFVLGSVGLSIAENAEYTIKLGLANEPTHYHAIAANKFGEIVEARTNGKIKVDVFPAQQLGSESEMISLTEVGTMQMFLASPGNVGNFVKEFQVMLCPFIWRDYDHLQKTMVGPIGQELADKMLAANKIRVLDFLWVNGARHLTTTKTPIQTPDDLKGMKVRASTAPIYIAAVKSLGANPVPVDFSELYMALQQGVVEGEENALGTIDAKKFYEVQKYIMLTGHIYQSQIVGINDAFYQSLPDDYKKIVLEAVKEARDYNNKLQLESDEKAAEKFRGLGVTIITPDIAAFRANAKDVGKELEHLWGPGLYERIIAVE
jgi:tripartite ATP-independent transporter DctP family solute receptor